MPTEIRNCTIPALETPKFRSSNWTHLAGEARPFLDLEISGFPVQESFDFEIPWDLWSPIRNHIPKLFTHFFRAGVLDPAAGASEVPDSLMRFKTACRKRYSI
jgi:hypothetical protein